MIGPSAMVEPARTRPAELSRPFSGDDLFAICRICQGPASPGHHCCWSCQQVCEQLGGRVPPVVPITNFVKGSELHRALSGYKASPAPRLRAARAALLQELLCGFLASHAACLLRPPPDSNLGPHLVVPVPSSTPDRPRRKGHPLVVLLDAVLSSLKESEDGPAARLVLADCLEARSPAAGRLRARRGAFGVKEGAGLVARGALAIVIDDVFTSGSRALSAAAALEDAGMLVRAVVPIGRLVRPEHNPATAAFWAVHAAGAEDIACCRLCKTASALSVRRGEVSSRVAA